MEVVYVRYDGCERSGFDARGAVAAAHAARRPGEEEEEERNDDE